MDIFPNKEVIVTGASLAALFGMLPQGCGSKKDIMTALIILDTTVETTGGTTQTDIEIDTTTSMTMKISTTATEGTDLIEMGIKML